MVQCGRWHPIQSLCSERCTRGHCKMCNRINKDILLRPIPSAVLVDTGASIVTMDKSRQAGATKSH